MIRALIRFLLFTVPENIIRGLEFILFDRDEITLTTYNVQDQYDKTIEERRILLEHLERCRRQIYKKGK